MKLFKYPLDPIACVGFVGNVISMYIYTRPQMAAPINVLLCALCAIDAVMLMMAIPAFAVPGLNMKLQNDALYMCIKYTTLYLYPITLMAQSASVLLMVVITVERYIAVCHPFRALHQVCVPCMGPACGMLVQTTERMRKVVVCVLSVSFAYNIIRFWEFTAHPVDELQTQINIRDNRSYYIIYYTSMFMLTHFAVPFTIFIVLNTMVARTLLRAKRDRKRLTRQEQGECPRAHTSCTRCRRTHRVGYDARRDARVRFVQSAHWRVEHCRNHRRVFLLRLSDTVLSAQRHQQLAGRCQLFNNMHNLLSIQPTLSSAVFDDCVL